MDVYVASLNADALGQHLLVAYSHSNTGADACWERHALERALEAFDKLSALIPAVRDRLSAVNAAALAEDA